MKNRIRSLKPGEPIPEGEPRRYIEGRGYVRLRWKVGPYAYVETYEHRIVDGRTTAAEHVHHRNENHGDNAPENLVNLTAAQHREEHRRIDHDLAAKMYREGSSTVQIGNLLGCHPSHVSRLLRSAGVTMRSGWPTPTEVDGDRLRALHASGKRVPSIAQALGVPQNAVRRAMRELDLPPFPPGRPPEDAA